MLINDYKKNTRFLDLTFLLFEIFMYLEYKDKVKDELCVQLFTIKWIQMPMIF